MALFLSHYESAIEPSAPERGVMESRKKIILGLRRAAMVEGER
jgi:hypothetical protein